MSAKKYILGIFTSVLLFAGCSKYDDDALWNELNDHASRLAALEQWQKTVNGNITTLQELVAALQNNDYVVSVEAFETPAPGGYKITFIKKGEVIIWNGAKGNTGHSPAIGVKEYPAASGVYYWTLDGVFIEVSGNKMPVTGFNGSNGQDGATPKVIIGSDDYWYISADGTATGTAPGTGWTSTGVKATGNTGAQGPQGDAIFAPNGVDNTNSDYVIFTLADGTDIELLRYKLMEITFEQPGVFVSGKSLVIDYESIGTTEPTNIRIVGLPSGWKGTVDLSAKQFTITPATTINAGNSYSEATVFVGDGNRVAAMYSLEINFTVAANEVDAIYYEYGEPTGKVYAVNNGTANTGLILHNQTISVWRSTPYPGSDVLLDFTGKTGVEAMAMIKGTWNNTLPGFWYDLPTFGPNWVIWTMTDVDRGSRSILASHYAIRKIDVQSSGVDIHWSQYMNNSYHENNFAYVWDLPLTWGAEFGVVMPF